MTVIAQKDISQKILVQMEEVSVLLMKVMILVSF